MQSIASSEQERRDIRSNPPLNMNVAEAAEYLNLGQRTLRHYIAMGRIKAVRLGKRVIVRRQDADKLLEEFAA